MCGHCKLPNSLHLPSCPVAKVTNCAALAECAPMSGKKKGDIAIWLQEKDTNSLDHRWWRSTHRYKRPLYLCTCVPECIPCMRPLFQHLCLKGFQARSSVINTCCHLTANTNTGNINYFVVFGVVTDLLSICRWWDILNIQTSNV